MSCLDRRRHLLLQPRRADDPVLRLLLDVRLPAGRRPGLGRRRLPRPRLPARRHRRAHDAQRRGPAARGRPQPRARLDDPQLRLLRPGLRLRARGDRPRRPAADDRRAGGRLLLPDDHERELPAPGDAGGRRGGHPARACTGSARPTATARRCGCSAPGTILREALAAAELLADDFGVAADVWSVTSFTELRRDGLAAEREARLAASTASGATAWVERCLGGERRAAGRRRHRLHEGASRRDPPVGAGPLRGARHRRLRPQRLPPRAARASSRSTATTSRSPRCRRSPTTGLGRAPRSRARSRATRSTPTRRTRRSAEEAAADDRGQGPRHRRLHRRAGDRDPRLRGRRRSSPRRA